MELIPVDREELNSLREGLRILERFESFRESFASMLYIFGITKSPVALMCAKRAIADHVADDHFEDGFDADEYAQHLQLQEIAVALPCNFDHLYYLTGRNITIRDEEFAYLKDNEGAQTLSFRYGGQFDINLDALEDVVLGEDESQLVDYMNQYGKSGIQSEAEKTRLQDKNLMTSMGIQGSKKVKSAVESLFND